MDDLPGSAAFGAWTHGLRHAERGSLRGADLAASLAVRTDFGCRPRGAACSVTVATGLNAGDIQFFLTAESSLFKTDVQLGANIVTAARGIRVPGLSAAPPKAEDIAEA